ncbi:MAG: MFS transporter [Actinomycetota bacterium]
MSPPARSSQRAAERGLKRALAAFSYRNYLIFWAGGLLSNIGRWIQDMVMPYILYRLTGSGFIVGFAAFLRFAPAIVVGPLAGLLADRFNRRTVLLVTQIALSVVAVALWAMWGLGLGNPTLLVVLAAVAGVIYALNTPAWQAFIPELVPREHLLGAITLSSAQMNAAKAIGPGLAGAILATLGPSWAFLFTAISYVAVIGAIAVISVPNRPRPVEQRRAVAAFADSVRYIAQHRELAACIAVMCAVAALGMPVLQLTPIFATDVFHLGPTGFGILAGALGFGGVVSAPILGGWTQHLARGRLIACSLLGYGLALITYAQARSFPFAVVAMALVGVGFLFTSSTVTSTMQLAVRDALRGRVVAVFTTAFAIAYPIGSLVQGWAVDHAGPRQTVTVAGVLLAVIATGLLASRGVQDRLNRTGLADEPALEAPAQGIAALDPRLLAN